ncbi:Hypothetical protein SynRCC307_0692 [Synechococcus sp. RCC307]|nr:Hypothetical protein SynRCC307_0692 [Synechococcus sp. RCC307]
MRLKVLLGAVVASAAGLAGIKADAGIPAKWEKWMMVDNAFVVDTEDVKIQGDHIRLWVERAAAGVEKANPSLKYETWDGKVRISCKDFHYQAERYVNNAGYKLLTLGLSPDWKKSDWLKIKPNVIAYPLADQLCFLTGSPGFTKEVTPPAWAQKIIDKFEGNNLPESTDVEVDFLEPEDS